MKYDVGDRQYEIVDNWGELPEGWSWGEVGGVAVDSEDNVHVFTRTDHPYMVFDKSGKLVDHWGEGLLPAAHGICVSLDDSIYFISHFSSVIFKFDKTGRHRFTLGRRDEPSDTGYEEQPWESIPQSPEQRVNGVNHSGPPFNWPTDLAVAEDGSLFVTDGYRNARVHKFTSDGELLSSWGEPGDSGKLKGTKDEPNHFHIPHGIWAYGGKVYAADRQNNRIQIFDLDGNYMEMWLGFTLPSKVYIDPAEEVVYVSELAARCTLADLNGNILGHLGAERSQEAGKFLAPHGIWKDSEQSLYVGEVMDGARLQKFVRTR
jgi:DNA-binding beta-propeller fold protein YncE